MGVCDMDTQTFLGGLGLHAGSAAPSCGFIKQYFPDDAVTGIFWIKPTNGDPPRRRVCLAEGNTFEEAGGDGSAPGHPAKSCAVLKQFFEADTGVYWVGLSTPKAVLCDTDHPDGQELGGDGSSANEASDSCEAIFTHYQTRTGRVPPSAIYWLRDAQGQTYRAYCEMLPTGGVYRGGDGKSRNRPSVDCGFLYRHWAPDSGAFFISTNLSDPSATAPVTCDMSDTAMGRNAGGDGSSRAAAAVSCTTIKNVFDGASGL